MPFDTAEGDDISHLRAHDPTALARRVPKSAPWAAAEGTLPSLALSAQKLAGQPRIQPRSGRKVRSRKSDTAHQAPGLQPVVEREVQCQLRYPRT